MQGSDREKQPPTPVRSGAEKIGEGANTSGKTVSSGGVLPPANALDGEFKASSPTDHEDGDALASGAASDSENGGDRRPTPVRMGMEGREEEEEVVEGSQREIHDGTTDIDWVVTVSGRSASGILPLRTVPVMELVFAKTDEPDRPLRRVLHFGEKLADVPERDLLSALHGSEPFSEPLEEPEPPAPRGKRGRGRP